MKMKYLIAVAAILISMQVAYAQKAYDNILYTATIDNSKATLVLADGYLLASTITVKSPQGGQLFTPAANEADDNGNLQFNAVHGDGRYKNNKGSWIQLKHLTDADLSKTIKAVYWDGKMQSKISFKQK